MTCKAEIKACFAEKAGKPGSKPLVKALPQMAAAVAHKPLQSDKLFLKGRAVYDAEVIGLYKRFVINLAACFSALAASAKSDDESGANI